MQGEITEKKRKKTGEEMTEIPGIMIASPKSGSGKTTVTSALLKIFQNNGMRPSAFKCGPDYIDPMFHRNVIGVPSYNLDSYFLEDGQLCELYTAHAKESGIAVAEGAMGLFDGIGGVQERGSAYHIASVLELPVVLVVDAHGMGRSILPLLAGFLQYDREKRIAGVILNRISENFYGQIAPIIEEELSTAVFGFLPRAAEFVLESRYLGLKLPGEISDLKRQIGDMAERLGKTVSVGKIAETASAAGNRREKECFGQQARMAEKKEGIERRTEIVGGECAVRIGVAKDEAFCFYYEENLSLLKQKGAELVFFSPLHDKSLPEQLDGILLGGGYPELYAKELEENSGMREAVRGAIEAGMPSAAECGGFMYLHEVLEDDKKECFRMCGVLPGKCFYTGRSVRFGYMELREKTQNFLDAGAVIKGHEFHYYDSEENGRDCFAGKPAGGKKWVCVHSRENAFWGFPHLYYPSNPGFAEHFVEKARKFHDTVSVSKVNGEC